MSAHQIAPTDLLHIDPKAECDRIATAIFEMLSTQLKRKGVVLGVSGGIDSSVVAALCVRALGKDRVVVLLMPEKDSASESTVLGRALAESLGVQAILEDITPVLEAAGCYHRRDEAIRKLFPEYGPGYKCKIALPSLTNSFRYALFSLVLESPSGERTKLRLPPDVYLGIVAATNFKQRVRKMLEYYHADRLNFAVAGTPNRLEFELGFFVKNGDGAADMKPIAHLYKSQVYQLARYLNIPEAIQLRPPTTDTYSMEQSQEEFYFSMPLTDMDVCLYGKDHGLAPEEVARIIGMSAEQVERAYAAIDSKRNATRYLHLEPLLVR